MLKSRILTVGLSLLPVAVLIFGLSGGCGRPHAVSHLAVVMPLTGDEATDGQGILRAAALALEEFKADKSFSGRIEIKAFDDRADPKEAVNVANLIISDPSVIAVIGHLTSGCSIPAARIYARAGIPMITPTAINADLTQQQNDPNWVYPRVVFRLPPLDSTQAAMTAGFIRKKLGLKRLAIAHDKTPYGKGLAYKLADHFKALGGAVLSMDGLAVGEKDFRAVLTRIKAGNSDGFYYGGLYTEFGLLLRQGRELGLQFPFISGTGSKTPALFDVAGSAAEGAYLAASGLPLERLSAGRMFIERYQRRYPNDEMTPFDHYGYMAAQILLETFKKAGANRSKIIELIRAQTHQVILGAVQFDGNGDNRDATVNMTRAQVQTRSFETIP